MGSAVGGGGGGGGVREGGGGLLNGFIFRTLSAIVSVPGLAACRRTDKLPSTGLPRHPSRCLTVFFFFFFFFKDWGGGGGGI